MNQDSGAPWKGVAEYVRAGEELGLFVILRDFQTNLTVQVLYISKDTSKTYVVRDEYLSTLHLVSRSMLYGDESESEFVDQYCMDFTYYVTEYVPNVIGEYLINQAFNHPDDHGFGPDINGTEYR